SPCGSPAWRKRAPRHRPNAPPRPAPPRLCWSRSTAQTQATMPQKKQQALPNKPSPAPRERGDPSRKRAVGEGLSGDAPSPVSGLLPEPPDPATRDRVEQPAAATRCGYVALIGAPNAGKSTLLNRLIGRKLAIVTPKAQTTRTRLLGIAIEGATQVIYVDTPGIFLPRRRLDRAMVAAAWSGAADADKTVLLVDAARMAQRGADDDTKGILDRLAATKRRVILALNKVDLVRREKLLAVADELFRSGVFEDVFMVSALTGDGVADLR